MNNIEFLQYHKYLKTKSLLGSIYRNYYIYPKLKQIIKGKLLDYGCGLGDMLSSYSNSVGLDINPFNVEYCQNRNLKAYLYNDKVLKSRKFETILLDNVIEHIEDPKSLISNIVKFCKENSILIIGVPGIMAYRADGDHKVFYDEANLIPLFEKYNFKFKNSFCTPWRSEFLNKYSKRYCKYFIFNYL